MPLNVVEKITELDTAEGRDVLWALDAPQNAMAQMNPYAIHLSGWIVGRHSAVRRLQLMYGSRVQGEILVSEKDGRAYKRLIGKLPWATLAGLYARKLLRWVLIKARLGGLERWKAVSDLLYSNLHQCGFNADVSLLGTPPRCTLRLKAVPASGTASIELCDFKINRPPLQTRTRNRPPRHQPLMLTAVGRSGTTWLMHLLSRHPCIAVFPRYPYESTIAERITTSYRDLIHSEVFREPYMRSLLRDKYLLAADLPHEELSLLTEEISGMIKRQIDDLLSSLMEVLDHLYSKARPKEGQLLDADLQNEPRYFAEKNGLRPEWLFWEMYPKAKEIFLVRDFRDMVCSALAFNAKRGTVKFGRQHVKSDREFVWYRAALARPWVLEPWHDRSDRAHLVRYEDLVLEPEKTLKSILRYLELDHSAEVVSCMAQQASPASDLLEQHKTSTSERKSIGRWRRDLEPEMQSECNIAFKDHLTTFGYPM